MKVFVFLPRALDVDLWRKNYATGTVPDETPYGYHFAKEVGCDVDFSIATSTPKGWLGLIDRGIRRFLGFDVRHAWHNRLALFSNSYDSVWTHTEYEYLALLFLARIMNAKVPVLIAQSIWLIDDWNKYSCLRRLLYRILLRRAAVMTFHSPENLEVARQEKLCQRCELVLFGISMDSFKLKAPHLPDATGRPIRILTMGNDKHRDWKTLFDAFGNRPEFQVCVGSSKYPKQLLADNFSIKPMTLTEVYEAYDWADCVVIPLHRNLHVSGSTASLESIACGVPVVVSDTGGLRAYFSDMHVRFVPVGDSGAMREAVCDALLNSKKTLSFASAAQLHITEAALTTRGFALRHAKLSKSLLCENALSRVS